MANVETSEVIVETQLEGGFLIIGEGKEGE